MENESNETVGNENKQCLVLSALCVELSPELNPFMAQLSCKCQHWPQCGLPALRVAKTEAVCDRNGQKLGSQTNSE